MVIGKEGTIEFLFDKDVIWLKVSMCYLLLMQVVDSLYDLLKDALSFPFFYSPVFPSFEITVQSLPLHMLHYQINGLVSVYRFVELYNVRVV